MELAKKRGLSINNAMKLMSKTQRNPESKELLMEIELNIDKEIVEKCPIYEGDNSEDLAKKLIKKYNLNETEGKIILTQLKEYF